MKTIKIALAAVLIALSAGYLGSPYLAASGFTEALKSYDAAEASEYIDYPSVRQGIKDDMNAEVARMVMEQGEDDPFAAAGAAFAGSLVGGMVDAMITPAGLEKILERAEQERSEEANDIGYKTFYDSLNRFHVTLTTDAKGNPIEKPVTMVFDRDGLFSWKLTKVDLPLDTLRDGMSGQDRNAEATRSQTRQAPERDPEARRGVAEEQTADPTSNEGMDYEQPGFFFEVDEDGNPLEDAEPGN